MPAYNIGRDATLSIIINGASFNPTALVKITYKQMADMLESRPLNSQPVREKVPKGWEGELTFDRASSVLDDYFSSEEAQFWAGGGQNDIKLLLTILTPSGGQAQYRFDNVVMANDDGGEFSAEAKIAQKVKFQAAQRPKVA